MAIIQRDPLADITHWEPFRGIERLQQDLNQWFDRLRHAGGGESHGLTFFPAAEMEDTDDVIYLRLEVPGMDAKDLTIEATDTSVVVRGERQSQFQRDDKGWVRSEFHYGKFERRIPLPVAIQPDKARAECTHGLLRLTLPKVQSDQPQAIKVGISEQ